MALEIKQETDEQTQQNLNHQNNLHKSITDSLKGDKIQNAILQDLGLSPGASSKPEKRSNIVEQEDSTDNEEEVQEEDSNQSDIEENSSDEAGNEDEEVIPKSKVQKRFDELTAKLKAQQKELEELKSSRQTPKDEITKQLEEMSTEQLKAAKIEVRKAQIKAQNDDAKLNDLIALEDKIDSVMQEAPKNFAKAQSDAYIRKANEIAESNEIPDIEKAAPTLLKLANEIYSEYPILQKDVNGQAMALELAVKHYKSINSSPGDRTKEIELKRQVNNLKKKTTLDTKGSKVNSDKVKLDALRNKAMGGTYSNKVDLVRNHPMFNVDKMIPDEFKR